MARVILEKVCDPHISILNNISILRENWLRRRNIDKAKLYIHPTTYDRLMVELATRPQAWVYEATRCGETILGLPIKEDPRVSPYHLVIREEDNMDSLDALRYMFNSNNLRLPKHYIINKGATILFWEDGTKTIVKRAEDDAHDIAKSFLWAYFQKHSGLSRTKANKYLTKIVEDNLEVV